LSLLLAQGVGFRDFGYLRDEFSISVTGLLIGLFGFFLIGVIDDLRPLKASGKLTAQIFVAIITISFLPVPESLGGFEISYSLWLLFAFAWLVVVPNAVNLLDGVDGLTGLLFTCFVSVLVLRAMMVGQMEWLALLLPVLAGTIVFLKFNWAPAKIFLGDSGSLTIGYLVAYTSLCFSYWSGPTSNLSPLILFGLVSVWLIDTGLAIARRFWRGAPSLKLITRRKKGQLYLFGLVRATMRVMRPDRQHIHHLFLGMGLSAAQTAISLSLFWLAFASLFFAGHLWISEPDGFYDHAWIYLGGVGLFMLLANGLFCLSLASNKERPSQVECIESIQRAG
jgi:UDP-GlcNAc:undecaprenyl-phosphate GlcNAc-1-phosphate transferase